MFTVPELAFSCGSFQPDVSAGSAGIRRSDYKPHNTREQPVLQKGGLYWL